MVFLFPKPEDRVALIAVEDGGLPTAVNFRVRTIPVLGTTPAIFGMAAAAYVLTYLSGAPLVPEPVFQVRIMEVSAC